MIVELPQTPQILFSEVEVGAIFKSYESYYMKIIDQFGKKCMVSLQNGRIYHQENDGMVELVDKITLKNA